MATSGTALAEQGALTHLHLWRNVLDANQVLQALHQVYKAQGNATHARQIVLLLQRLREEEAPEAGPQSDSEDEPVSSPSPSPTKARRKPAHKGGLPDADAAQGKALLYGEGPEDYDDVVPDEGHGQGAQLLFTHFVAPGTSLAALTAARAPSGYAGSGSPGKSSAQSSPHKAPHLSASSPGRALGSEHRALGSSAVGRHLGDGEGGGGASGSGLGGVAEELDAAHDADDPYADDALDGEADEGAGAQSMGAHGEHGSQSFDGHSSFDRRLSDAPPAVEQPRFLLRMLVRLCPSVSGLSVCIWPVSAMLNDLLSCVMCSPGDFARPPRKRSKRSPRWQALSPACRSSRKLLVDARL